MNRISAQDVRLSIEYYKSLKGTDWSSFNAEILLHQKPIYNFIHNNEDKLYTRNELICLEYCTYIAATSQKNHPKIRFFYSEKYR